MNKILTYFASGTAAVILLGMLFYRFAIFNVHSPNFQFVEVGILASVLYPVCLYKENRDIFFISVMIMVLHYIIFRPVNFQWFIRDLVYLAGIISAIIAYTFYIFPMVRKYKLVRIFALPFVLGIFYVATFFILALESWLFFGVHIPYFWAMVLLFLKYGVMIGFGLAIGFNFADFIVKQYIELKPVKNS